MSAARRAIGLRTGSIIGLLWRPGIGVRATESGPPRRPAPKGCFGVCCYQSWLAGQPPVLAGEQVRVIDPLLFVIVNRSPDFDSAVIV